MVDGSTAARGPAIDWDLVTAHIDLVRSLAWRRCGRAGVFTDFTVDDVIAWGMRGLIDAARRFDPDAGVVFGAFACQRIVWAINDGFRHEGWVTRTQHRRGARRPASFEDVRDRNAGQDRGDEHEIGPIDPGIPDPCEDVAEQLDLHAAIDRLPPREHEVIDLYYFEDRSLAQIGERWGVSESMACRVKTSAERHLAALMR